MTHPGGPEDWNPPPRPSGQFPGPPPAAFRSPSPPAPYGAPAGYGPPPVAGPPAAYGTPGGGYGFGYSPVAHLPLSSAGKRFGAALLEGLLMIVTLWIDWLIWLLIVMGQGQTPAKQLLNMRCVDKSTARSATWGTMALRELVGKTLLGNITCGITSLVGALMVLGDSREALWDKIAGTVVVDDPQGTLAP